MADARQDDELDPGNAGLELASQQGLRLHPVSIADNDRGGHIDFSDKVADVERHAFLRPSVLGSRRPAESIVDNLLSEIRRELLVCDARERHIDAGGALIAL